MEMMSGMAKLLMGAGLFLILIGIFLYFSSRIPGIGRLPGDIWYQKGNFSFFFPITTSILISILATALINLFGRR
ncbi:MAG: DUF2905 domain-containing protein [Candidatus Omnitrophica bacterium]|nr:DUF2905 domain-containing protein [Candidatus Omnitrophota bacterium]